MAHHDERAANVLARGPAKSDDIENARRGAAEARATERSHAEQAIGEIDAPLACRAFVGPDVESAWKQCEYGGHQRVKRLWHSRKRMAAVG